MAFLSSLLSALFMWTAIWLLSRKEGTVSLRPVLVICLLTCLGTFLALRFFDIWGMLPVLAGLVFALIHWCFLTWPKAIIVTLVWLITQIGFGRWISPIF